MPSRHRSRQRALQILYQLDMYKRPVGEALSAFYDSLYSSEGENEFEAELTPPEQDTFMESLVVGAAARAGDIDQTISVHSEHWRLERMPAVDRNILRLAIFELMNENTPAAVIIDEALELARRFSGDDSVPFINGVLDAVRKQLSEKGENVGS
jgi:N utilization substance protein B